MIVSGLTHVDPRKCQFLPEYTLKNISAFEIESTFLNFLLQY